MADPSTARYELLRVRREDDLLFVTLNNPDKANALSPPLLEELTALYRRDLLGKGIRAVLLDGEGKHFSAGADLGHLRSLQDASEDDHRRDSQALRGLFESVLRQPALTVALVHGACIAGGCGLATAHDFVVAAEDAKFMYSEVRIGFVAALVATYLPLRLKGADIREVLLNPELFDAARALEIGLVNRVVPERRSGGGGPGAGDRHPVAGELPVDRPDQGAALGAGRPTSRPGLRPRRGGQRHGPIHRRLQARHRPLPRAQEAADLAVGGSGRSGRRLTEGPAQPATPTSRSTVSGPRLLTVSKPWRSRTRSAPAKPRALTDTPSIRSRLLGTTMIQRRVTSRL